MKLCQCILSLLLCLVSSASQASPSQPENFQQLAWTTSTYIEIGPGGISSRSQEVKSLKSCESNTNLSTQKSPFKLGDSTLVEWQGNWFKATVIGVYGNNIGSQTFKIHYDGWDDKWDETISYARILHLSKCDNPKPKDETNAWLLIFIKEAPNGEISKIGAISSPQAQVFNMNTSNESQVKCLKIANDKNYAMDKDDRDSKWWTCEPKSHVSDGVNNNNI